MFRKDSLELFRELDENKDRTMDLKEFVAWQRKALAKSGLHNEDLATLIPGLSRQLTCP